MKNKKILFFLILFLLFLVSPSVLAEDNEFFEDDPEIFGLELEKLLNLGSGILATLLFIVTIVAYKRNKRKRLLYVCLAFFLFAVKGFLTAHELFFAEWNWVDPIASLLTFAILLSFFAGILKK